MAQIGNSVTPMDWKAISTATMDMLKVQQLPADV
jgi:hypothetical protein